MPVDPSSAAGFSVQGPEWEVQGIGGADAVAPAGQPPKPESGGFGDMLANQVGELSKVQDEAAGASQSLVDGTATDASSVVMAVERARLSMQLASQIRNKGVEAYRDVFTTQV